MQFKCCSDIYEVYPNIGTEGSCLEHASFHSDPRLQDIVWFIAMYNGVKKGDVVHG